MDQWIVDHDLFRLDLFSVLHHRQLRPPALGRSVSVVLLSCAEALHTKGELLLSARAQFNDVAGLPLLQHQKPAITKNAVDDTAGEDQKEAGMDDVHRHDREAMPLGI